MKKFFTLAIMGLTGFTFASCSNNTDKTIDTFAEDTVIFDTICDTIPADTLFEGVL